VQSSGGVAAVSVFDVGSAETKVDATGGNMNEGMVSIDDLLDLSFSSKQTPSNIVPPSSLFGSSVWP